MNSATTQIVQRLESAYPRAGIFGYNGRYG
jgi:hypothetical protein